MKNNNRRSIPTDILGTLMAGEPAVVAREKAKPIIQKKDTPVELESSGDFVRSTLIIRKRYLDKIKVLSIEGDQSIKDLLDQALARFFTSDDIQKNYSKQIERLKS